MQTRAPTPREIVGESLRNSRGRPWNPLAAFEVIGGPRFLEFLPDASSAPGSHAAGAVGASPVPAATFQENE
jgi:hypothetical protein